jgi:hypothetical protein
MLIGFYFKQFTLYIKCDINNDIFIKEVFMPNTIELPNIPNEKQLIYTYLFELKFYNEDTIIEPVSIENIYKECDYTNNFNPILLMNIQVKKTDLFMLKRLHHELLASITITANQYMRLLPGEDSGAESTSLINTEIIASGTFMPVFSQNAFDERYREDEYENKENMVNDDETTDTRETDRVTIDVQFEDLIAVNSKKTLFNIVAEKGVTIGTILQYVIDFLPVKGAIVDKPDNEYELGETIIPPGNLVPMLRTMQYTIGIYENGLLAFYDDDVFYILNKYALDHDCKEGEKIITHIYITEMDKMLGGITVRGLDPSNDEPTYIGPIVAKATQNEVLSAELDGNNFIFSSFRQGLSAVQFNDGKAESTNSKPVAMAMKRNLEVYKHSIDKNILTYDELGNLYNMASYFNELEATVKQMLIKVENVNIADFRANKFINLHFIDENKNMRLGGVYHINNVSNIFIPVNKISTKEMMCISTVLLSRRNV